MTFEETLIEGCGYDNFEGYRKCAKGNLCPVCRNHIDLLRAATRELESGCNDKCMFKEDSRRVQALIHSIMVEPKVEEVKVYDPIPDRGRGRK